jgi:hypothetical protein
VKKRQIKVWNSFSSKHFVFRLFLFKWDSSKIY